MEKLLDLLQEFYGDNRTFSNDDGLLTMTNGVENLSGAYAQTYIISKQGGFIKWLVENDKIDLENVKEKIGIPCFVWYTEGEISCVNDKEDYEQLLMLLAIQDEPIRFLCEILK